MSSFRGKIEVHVQEQNQCVQCTEINGESNDIFLRCLLFGENFKLD